MNPNIAIEALRQALPTLLGNLDDATFEAIRPHLPKEWVKLAGGEVLFNAGDPSDSLYLVISGRLQASVAGPKGESQIVGEIGRGESVGEMGAFTARPRSATITALRDSVLARIELAAFNEMLKASPGLALNLNRIIIERLERSNTSQKPAHNITNIAVLSISRGLQTSPALQHLVAELKGQQESVLHLTSAMIDSAAGRVDAAQATDDDPDAHHWLVRYLDELEERHALVCYEADAGITPWTRRCLRMADEVLLLASSDASAELSAVEQACLNDSGATRARQTLVVLQPADAVSAVSATGTQRFFAVRPRVQRHFHVRASSKKDMARLARFLSNKAVGLVLAGGGAPGIAHIGVFRALEEAGVPIDAVGGTSIGSVVGAGIAFDRGWKWVYEENRPRFMSNPTSDFNYLPLVSLLAGRKLDRILENSPIGGRDIEDLWLPFYCVSSNWSQACENVHTRGNLKRALLASMAIPGVFPPVIHGNDLLVDGAVFNNMPVDVMSRAGVRTILAVDLRGLDKPCGPYDFAQVPGTWALLLDRLQPKARRRYRLPSILATLMETITLNSHQRMNACAQDVDLLFTPDVARFGVLEWKSYDALVEEGYRHGQEMLAKHWPAMQSGDDCATVGGLANT